MMPVNDPTDAEALSFELFERSMFDRRHEHAPKYRTSWRSWSTVTGICLHQTACHMGERIERYDTIGAHFAVTRMGKVLRMADLNRVVVHGNGWNAQTVGIEIDGLYAGIEGNPRTVWDDPTTPFREVAQQVTPEAMRATRQLCRWIVGEVARNGGKVRALVAHRQASRNRRNDPGSAIWQQVALPLHAELGLSDGGVGFKLDDGYPIPEDWDARCEGVPY